MPQAGISAEVCSGPAPLDVLAVRGEEKIRVVHTQLHRNSTLLQRQDFWTESLAVGSDSFTKKVAQMLGVRSRFRKVERNSESSVLREAGMSYRSNYEVKMGTLKPYTRPDIA